MVAYECSSRAYYSNVNLFPDLAIIALQAPIKGQLLAFLSALAIRKHVELSLVFERLVGAGEWTVSALFIRKCAD